MIPDDLENPIYLAFLTHAEWEAWKRDNLTSKMTILEVMEYGGWTIVTIYLED